MTKKEKFLNNWNDFTEIILPELQKKYKVSQHDWMFKIRTNNKIYNYYPKGERIQVQNYTHTKYNHFQDMSLKEFEEQFICLTAQ